MNAPYKIQSSPFLSLLYTEWVMLAFCFSFAVIEYHKEQHLPIQHGVILAVLGLLSLMVPNGNFFSKVLCTVIELGLIFYGATLGYFHILPTLYVIVLFRSCFLFEKPIRWAIAGLSFILFLVHQIKYVNSSTLMVALADQQRVWMHLVAETLMFGLALVFVLLFVNLWLTKCTMRDQLITAHNQLQHYARQIEDYTAVQERNRIARDVHDSLGHTLAAQNIQLQTAIKLWQRDPEKAQPFVKQAQQLGTIAMKEVRQSVGALRADARHDQPLTEAIESLVDDFRQSTGTHPLVKR